MAKIDALFNLLMTKGGSDLHLEESQKPKIRLHGHLESLNDQPVLTRESMTELLKEITSAENWQRYENHGDLDFAYALGTQARFRCNYLKHFFGFGAVFRIIPSKIVPLETLGMPATLKTFSQLSSGIVLVTGPTGSGKSTTMAAIIDYINETSQKKIVTIEEPVEFVHPNKSSNIIHREVGLDTPSFSSGLKSAIKSDANIILVGEMRDQETISLALTAAQMGILVFGTLHTNSAAKTIDRIIDVFPASKKNQVRTNLSNTLKAVVAQQLLISKDKTRRYVAYEILLKSLGLSAIIMNGETVKLTSEIQTNRSMGMILMDDCLMQLVKDGKVSMEDAYMKAIDKSKFMNAPVGF